MAGITHTSPHRVEDQSGQISCFNCVIEAHQTQAYNLARRMLSDWALAEDAVQESFISAYRAFRRFRGENLTAWVLRGVFYAPPFSCQTLRHSHLRGHTRVVRILLSTASGSGAIREVFLWE